MFFNIIYAVFLMFSIMVVYGILDNRQEIYEYITTKKKTGWTAPMGYWMKGHKCLLDLHEQKLKKPFNMQKDINQKTGKRLAVDMQWATWFEHFRVENY